MTDLERTPQKAADYIASHRLSFGDPEQIRAMRLIEAADSLVGATAECIDCDGEGTDDDGAACRGCNGTRRKAYDRSTVYRLTAWQIAALLMMKGNAGVTGGGAVQ
jgi:hypothetical protein